MSKQKYPQATTVSTSTGTTIRKGRERYSSVKRNAKLNLLRREADDRQAVYDSLDLKEKLALVKSRGGSVKELTRLNATLKAEKAAKKPVVSEQQRRDEKNGLYGGRENVAN
jgi:hypothetical protein